MTIRRALGRAAAVSGAACLVVAALVPRAGAQTPPLDSYQAAGTGEGIVMMFAVRPSIFDPLAHAGLVYSEASLSSQGGGSANAIAAQAFPGTFAIGAVGCGGIPGGQVVTGQYPPTEACRTSNETTFADSRTFKAGRPELDAALAQLHDRMFVKQGRLRASTALGRSESTVVVADYEIRPDPRGAPLVRAEQVRSVTWGRFFGSGVEHQTTVTLDDVSLVGGGITIDRIVSSARTTSNGVTATADANLRIGRVRVTADGGTHEAEVTSEGVRVTDADLDREARLSLEEEIRERLTRAGIRITLAHPDEIVDGAAADASAGGLVLSLSATVPSADVPQEVARVVAPLLSAIPTQCLSDFGAPIPLCFGSGVVPGPESEIFLQLSLGSARSMSVTTPPTIFDPGTTTTGGTTSTTTGGSFGPVPGTGGTGGFGDVTTGGATTGATGGPATGQAGQRPVLTGLVARMPAAALVWAGAGLLVLAAALGLGPSLRHAGAR